MDEYRKLHPDDKELEKYKYWSMKNLRLLLRELCQENGGMSIRDLRFIDYIEEIIDIKESRGIM
tara:strand:- start:351 stop:542 length:192 start_codon:yes stop_codon:yes gene_type:complete